MSNPFEQSFFSQPETDAGKNKRFQTISEAAEYSKRTLGLGQPPKDTGNLPWEKPAVASGPRDAFGLRLDYLGDHKWRESLEQNAAFMGTLQEVNLHDGYDVKPDAPEKIKKLAEKLRELGQQLPFDIAFMELQAKEIEDGTHPLCLNLRQAEEDKDMAQIQNLKGEINAFRGILQEDLERYKNALNFVQNRQVWERTLAPKAARLKRLHKLREIIESPRLEGELTEPESDAYLIAKAEAAREMEAIMKTGLAPGNPDLQLYLYQNPNLDPSLEFAPQD